MNAADALLQPFQLMFRHRHLLWSITKRDLLMPYAGQILGAWWAIGHPLVMVALYAIVFNFLVGARFGGNAELPLDYTVFLLSGLLPWITFSNVMTRSTMEIVSNANIVKQVVFPIEVLPIKSVFVNLVSFSIGLLFIIGYTLIQYRTLPQLMWLLPLVFVVHIMWMIGVAFISAAIGTYIRDLKELYQIFTLAGIYILPIIYTPTSIPTALYWVIVLNPFSCLVWVYRDVLYFGRIDNLWAWVGFFIYSLLSFFLGYHVFRRLKVYFGNIL
jgi:lipopolysaccharide transport system permease protein